MNQRVQCGLGQHPAQPPVSRAQVEQQDRIGLWTRDASQLSLSNRNTETGTSFGHATPGNDRVSCELNDDWPPACPCVIRSVIRCASRSAFGCALPYSVVLLRPNPSPRPSRKHMRTPCLSSLKGHAPNSPSSTSAIGSSLFLAIRATSCATGTTASCLLVPSPSSRFVKDALSTTSRCSRGCPWTIAVTFPVTCRSEAHSKPMPG